MTLTGFLIDLILDWDDIPSYEHLAVESEPESNVRTTPRPGRIAEPFVLPMPRFGNGSGRRRGDWLLGGAAAVGGFLLPVPMLPYWMLDPLKTLLPEEEPQVY